MDIGAFNVFTMLNRSLIKSNYKLFTAGDYQWTVPAGVKSSTIYLQASGGGAANGTTNGAGGAGASLIILGMPVLPGMILSCLYWDGSNFQVGPPPGGPAGAPASNGTDGKAIRLMFGVPGGSFSATSCLTVSPGKGGTTAGAGGEGGSTINTTVAGGGKAAETSVNPITEWLDLLGLNLKVIRVPGAGGGNKYDGLSYPDGYGGDSPLARGGFPLLVNSAGGGASLFGKGGDANAPGIYGSGGGSKSGAGSSQAGGDGFGLIFWEGKKS